MYCVSTFVCLREIIDSLFGLYSGVAEGLVILENLVILVDLVVLGNLANLGIVPQITQIFTNL